MNNKTLVPEMRFGGYDGEWDTVRLTDVAKLTMGQSPSGKNYTTNPNDHILVQGNADMKNGEVLPRVWTTEITKTAVPGDIIMSVRAPVGDVGTTNYHVVLGRGVAGIRANSFVYSYLEALKQNNYWDEFSTGSTFKSINSNHLARLEVKVPENTEQKHIGAFLSDIDSHLKSKQKELTKLQNFKLAMIQKIVPKEGENVPEVRFEGFEGEWDECTINDVGMVVTGNTPPTSDTTNYSSSGTLWVTPTDIKSPVTESTEKRLSDKGENKARIVPKGSILVTCIASLGKNTLVLEKSGLNQQINAIIPKDGFDSYFLLALSNHWSNTMKKIAGAGTMDIVNRTEFTKIKTRIPSYAEQKQVGQYFYTLDKHIRAKQAELKKLKQFKQAMLNKLFV